ncbi:hypothetical protein [Rhizobium mayense]|uniref:Secreted protein n=1 Tax=Rhizobium mayense TaxID=1312184 RepID=A0ABT7K2Z4_9HYPH|nr:hypothetical protein [Rhizobium mayense]MDL2402974.1 hypothetical protein [Rhizobium mayense]
MALTSALTAGALVCEAFCSLQLASANVAATPAATNNIRMTGGRLKAAARTITGVEEASVRTLLFPIVLITVPSSTKNICTVINVNLIWLF